MLCMAVACFRECCQHAPVSRTAGSGSLLSLCWLSGRGGFKPDREFIRAKVSPGWLLSGREGRAPFSYSSAFLRWEMDCQLLLSATLARRVAHRFQIPPRGGSAIGVGDINPTQVSFLRE